MQEPMGEVIGGTVGLIIASLTWLVIGVLVGAAARFLLPGPDPASLWLTALYGIIGAFVGGLISHLLGWTGFVSFLPAIAVAMVAVWLNRLRRRKSP